MAFDIRPPAPYELDPEVCWAWYEDFHSGGYSSAAHITRRGLVRSAVAGGGDWFYEPTTATEVGIVRLTTAGGAGDLVTLGTHQSILYGIPVNTALEIKFKLPAVDQLSAFVGVADAVSADYRVGANANLIGFRLDRAVDDHLYAVLKDGAGGGNETLMDLGVADTDWHTVKMVRYTDAILRVYLDGAVVEDFDDLSNLPAAGLKVKAGVGGIIGVAKSVYIDYIFLWGQADRL